MTVSNCFRHTKLLDKCLNVESMTNPDDNDEEAEGINRELHEAIDHLAPWNPMSIEALFNPAEERQHVHQEFTDDELLEMVEVTAVKDVEEEAVEAQPEELPMSNNEKIAHLSAAIDLLDLT